MIDLSNIKNYYIACGYTDLRRGIDGLAQIVTLQYGYEIDENSLFLFCGRRTDRIKALWFSGDGFVLLYKRLNNGSFQWPRSKDELKLLTPQSFRWLMEGLTTEPKKVIKKSRQKERDQFLNLHSVGSFPVLSLLFYHKKIILQEFRPTIHNYFNSVTKSSCILQSVMV